MRRIRSLLAAPTGLDFESWMFDFGMLDFGRWILDIGFCHPFCPYIRKDVLGTPTADFLLRGNLFD